MALLACFFISCSNDNEVTDAVPADGTQVSFVLSLSNATNGTRATWSDNTGEDGDDYENRINPDDLHVLLYSTDNTCVATVTILSYYPINDENALYEFIGSVDPVNGGTLAPGTYKMMVFANCGNVISSSTDDLNELSYIYVPDAVKSGDQYIPMWGVLTHDFRFEKGKRDKMGTIDLLRAFAKVEINLDETTSQQYTITSATLNKYNTQGYCLPAGYANASATSELEQESGSFHPYTTSSQGTDLKFTLAENDTKAYVYIPEFDNSPSDEAVITLSLKAKDPNHQKDIVDAHLKFTHYEGGVSTGEAQDIVRNHIYRYTVNVELGRIDVTYKVQPWELVESLIGDEISEDDYSLIAYDGSKTNGTKGDPEARFCILSRPPYKDESHNTLGTGTGGARFQFTLKEPKGAVWTAHLTNEEVFSFSYSEAEGRKMVSTGIAREEPYYIQININPGKDWTDANFNLAEWGRENEELHRVPSTYFYITVSVDGGKEQVLKINPRLENQKYSYYKDKRRFAGTETRVWIRQVQALKGWKNYEDLAKDVSPTATKEKDPDIDETDEFMWWRVNPYWN